MNRLGAERRPFLFVIDYKQEQVIVEEPDQIDSEAFVSSEARYKLWMKDRFVVFSPEIFVKIRDEHIYSYPMKGTIDATLPDARRRILEDPKETAEHATIVDLIRNDLSMVATEVMVTRYRYIDELPTHQGALLQVSSEIRGRLAGGWQAEVGDLFFRLLPVRKPGISSG